MKFKRRFYRKFRYNRKRSFMFIFLFLLCLSFGLGYSLISTDLNIFGTTVLKDNRWSVYFDNIQEIEGSVSPTIEPEITNDTTVSFSAKLKNPGDKYEFLIDVVNDGTIDAKIGNISMSPTLTEEQQNFFSYEVTYESGVTLSENQALDAGSTETLKVSFKYLEQEDNSLYPDTDQTFNVVLTGEYVQGTGTPVVHPYLYNVLMNEAESGGLAKKYTGEHHDSFTEEPTKDIYHWYASNDSQGTQVLDKNNVIFANHCWQMIRTTDTGGVKMIYNGEVVNNQCLNTRGNHIGYGKEYNSLYFDYNYWYGTDYTYDSTNNLFSISGTKVQAVWSDSTYENLLGKYTCRSTNENGTCSTLYFINTYYNSTRANYFKIVNNVNYSHYGTLQFNSDSDSLSRIGYMYNNSYPNNTKVMSLGEHTLSSYSLSTSYWYADSVTWGTPTANKYNLDNPYQISSSNDYSNLVGKYTFRNSSQSYTNSNVYYIAAVSGSTMYYIQLNDGNNLSYYNYTYTYGESYTDNGNGTYTINNPTTIYKVDWISNYNVVKNKYLCIDAVNNTCSDLGYIHYTSNNSMSYTLVSNYYKYANGFSYDATNHKYILNNDSVSFWKFNDDTNLNSIYSHRYTCWNDTGECSTISYIYYITSNTFHNIQLNDGKNISDVLNEMLYDNNVNTVNSTIKSGVDAWYKNYLLEDYDDYIEDTVFCNRRTIENISTSGWNPNYNGNGYLQFFSNGDLNCQNETDKFSVYNNKAKLTYKVGLITRYEISLLNKAELWANFPYWTITPNTYIFEAYNHYIEFGDYYDSGKTVKEAYGVKPVISLKPKTKYLSGTGTMANPYVIN